MAMLVTHLSAAAATIAWMAIEWIKFGKPSLVGAVTGTIAGLAAITPDQWSALRHIRDLRESLQTPQSPIEGLGEATSRRSPNPSNRTEGGKAK